MKTHLFFAASLCATALLFACSGDDDADDDVGTSSSSSGGTTTSSSSGAATSSSSSGSTGSSSGGASSSSSSGGSSSGGSDAGTDDCTAVTLSDFELSINDGEAPYAIFGGTFAPETDGESAVSLEFSTDATPGIYHLSDETQHQSANHGVLLGGDNKYWFNASGDINITALSFEAGTVTAHLTNVKLVEVTIAGDATSTVVPNGSCLTIADATIDIQGE